MVINKIRSTFGKPSGSRSTTDTSLEGIDEGPLESNIQDPEEKDILLGRGRNSWSHTGNQQFRSFVGLYLKQYTDAASRSEKTKTVELIYNEVIKNGGRFLKLDSSTNTWFQVGKTVAREKIAHTLRDAIGLRIKLTPDEEEDVPNTGFAPPPKAKRASSSAKSDGGRGSAAAVQPFCDPPPHSRKPPPISSDDVHLKMSVHSQSFPDSSKSGDLPLRRSNNNHEMSHKIKHTSHFENAMQPPVTMTKTMVSDKDTFNTLMNTMLKDMDGLPDDSAKFRAMQQAPLMFDDSSGRDRLMKEALLFDESSERDRHHSTGSHFDEELSTGLSAMSIDNTSAKSSKSGLSWSLKSGTVGSEKKNSLYDSSVFAPSQTFQNTNPSGARSAGPRHGYAQGHKPNPQFQKHGNGMYMADPNMKRNGHVVQQDSHLFDHEVEQTIQSLDWGKASHHSDDFSVADSMESLNGQSRGRSVHIYEGAVNKSDCWTSKASLQSDDFSAMGSLDSNTLTLNSRQMLKSEGSEMSNDTETEWRKTLKALQQG